MKILIDVDQLAEVLVLGQYDAGIPPGPVENAPVGRSGPFLADGDDVVASCAKGGDDAVVTALVGQEAHGCYRDWATGRFSVWAISSAAKATAARRSSRVRCG